MWERCGPTTGQGARVGEQPERLWLWWSTALRERAAETAERSAKKVITARRAVSGLPQQLCCMQMQAMEAHVQALEQYMLQVHAAHVDVQQRPCTVVHWWGAGGGSCWC